MKLEVGKFYKTRDGRKVQIVGVTGELRFPIEGSNGETYTYSGTVWTDSPSDRDLIALWQDAPTGPVRTVTRTTREIVNGVHGAFWIGETWGDETKATIGMRNSKDDTMHALSADELREAAAHFIAVAEALEEK